MSLRRAVTALLLFTLIAAAFGACTPFGDDDDNDDDVGTQVPTSPTREVVMATFTATEVVPPDQKTATAEAQQTAAAATQEARGNLPTPTPAASVAEEDLLYPPRTRLETPNELIEGYLGTYSWQFSDEEETYASIEAPILALDQAEPATVQNGDDMLIRYYGDEYRTPPQQLEVAVYDFDANSAVPASSQGAGDELAFAIKTDPVQNLRVDPDNPSFTLQGFPPGHYVIWAQGRWGQHPALERQIFVTWVFDIEIAE